MTVYRDLSIRKGEKLFPISKTDIVSTSFDINECCKFLCRHQNNEHYLYQFNLERTAPVAICLYSVLLDEKENRLILTQRQDQKEIIFLKSNFEFEPALTTITPLNNKTQLNIIVMNLKEKFKQNKKVSFRK